MASSNEATKATAEALRAAQAAHEAGHARVTEAEAKLTAANDALTAAMAGEAAGGPSSKPARQQVQDSVHALEVARAGMPALEQALQAAGEAHEAAVREDLRARLTQAAKELDEHPAAAAVAEAFLQTRDFQEKKLAMRRLREQYEAAGGDSHEFPARKLKAKGTCLSDFEATVGRDMVGVTKSELVVVTSS